MTISKVNSLRVDPYKDFKFRLKWDGRYVAGFSKVGWLNRRSDKLPSRTKYDAITLDRGVTHDTAFEQSANQVWKLGEARGPKVSSSDFRKDARLELFNGAGQLASAYNIFRCWVSEYQTMLDLDANANAVTIGHIKLENEGWERDLSVPPPTGPKFNIPPNR